MKNLIKSFLFILLFALTIACNNDINTPGSIKHIDITNAKALMVIPETAAMKSIASASTRAGGNNHLYKMKDDGSIERVICKNGSSNEVDYLPSKIFEAGDYVILTSGYSDAYLVSKKNGNAYDLSPYGAPQTFRANLGYDGEYRQSVFTDNAGNVYYVNNTVKKINVSNPDNITAESITPDVYNIGDCDEFCVDKNGNVFFTSENNFITTARVRTTSGSLKSIELDRTSSPCTAFTGYDKEIYIQRKDSLLEKISIDEAENITITEVGNIPTRTWYSGGYRWLYMEDKIMLFPSHNSGDDKFAITLYDTNSTFPTSVNNDFLASASARFIKGSNDKYYVAGVNGSIISVNPETNEAKTIIEKDNYDILNMEVTSVNVIIFNALRYSDSKKILGKITADGVISMIVEDIQSDISVLKKIN